MCIQQGKYSEAEMLLKTRLKQQQLLLGEAHPDTTTTMKDLVAVLMKQGKDDDAEILFKSYLGKMLTHASSSSSYAYSDNQIGLDIDNDTNQNPTTTTTTKTTSNTTTIGYNNV